MTDTHCLGSFSQAHCSDSNIESLEKAPSIFLIRCTAIGSVTKELPPAQDCTPTPEAAYPEVKPCEVWQ